MHKIEELSNPNSCINWAEDDEMVFVLLGRDAAAPYAIRQWVQQRLSLGKNDPGDDQISEALDCANEMERQQSAAAERGKE